jgi:16S rRNA (guanine527-N7)-methyltransferase
VDAIEATLEWYGVNEAREKHEKITEYLSWIGMRRDWAGLVSRSVARRPFEAAVDSLGVLDILGCRTPCGIVDIGSGGGLLGLTLAIACETWHVTLVEASARKCAALAEAVGKFGLENARVLHGRAEKLAGSASFAFAASRGAGALSVVGPVALDLLEHGGRYIATKGARVEEEVEQALPVLEKAGGKVVEVRWPGHEKALGREQRTSLVVVEKM